MIALARVMALIALTVISPSAPDAVAVKATVDRPAIWIADRLTYTVEIVCPKGIDILTGDAAADKLKLTGLELVGAATRRQDEGNAIRYTFDYVLTTYGVDVATPSIGSFPVRYYLTRPGQLPEDAAPAGAVTVPPIAIAFRSLLPDDRNGYDIRDDRPLPPRWLPYRLLGPVGIGLILVSIAPVAMLLVRAAARTRERRRAAPLSARRVKQATRSALEDLRVIDGREATLRRDAFARLDVLIREHLAGVTGISAQGMTVDEIRAALDRQAPHIPVATVISVLDACELARYGGPELQPSADAWRHALAKTDEIL